MSKTILITGATDGIGLVTARKLVESGHKVLLHGRNTSKLDAVMESLAEYKNQIQGYIADLSNLEQVTKLAQELLRTQTQIDVLINNAGILKAPKTQTQAGLDVRFVVNTLAPYLLSQSLMPLFNKESRVVSLSSAAQAPIDIQGLLGNKGYHNDMAAYAQSKLALTIWSKGLADEHAETGPSFIAVNPGSLLASKMVKEGFGVAGNDLSIGANILIKAALSDEFSQASGQYFDNDIGRFSDPHPDALDKVKIETVMSAIHTLVKPHINTSL